MAKQSGGTKSTSWRTKNVSSTPKTVLGLSEPKYNMPKGTVEYRNTESDRIAGELKWMRDYIKDNNTGGSLELNGNDYIIFHMKGNAESKGMPYDITLQRGDDVLPKGIKASQIRAIDHWMSGDTGGTNVLSTRNAEIVTERYKGNRSLSKE